MREINPIHEPRKLLLLWKAKQTTGRNFLVGELIRKDTIVEFRYNTETRDFEDAKGDGFVGYPGFKIRSEPYKYGVMESFSKRLPARKRNDFNEYLDKLHLPHTVRDTISDFALLGYSEAKWPGDGFSLFNIFEGIIPPFAFVIELSGVRHLHYDVKQLKLGEPVQFVEEPDNEYDGNAIIVKMKNEKIGYINRCQTTYFKQWIRQFSIQAHLTRVNGTLENPRVFLFVEVN